MSTGSQYEFTKEQNAEIGALAGKMRFVGFFSAAFGLLALLVCLFAVLFMFRDRLPRGFREKAKEFAKKAQEKLPEDLKKEAADHSLDHIPTDNTFLTGIAVFAGVTGLIFLLQGVWTRSAGGSFQKIVDTEGNDVTHLMGAIGSLRSMYGQLHLLLMAALVAGLVAVGMTIYHYAGS